jgi:hypothetical protein
VVQDAALAPKNVAFYTVKGDQPHWTHHRTGFPQHRHDEMYVCHLIQCVQFKQALITFLLRIWECHEQSVRLNYYMIILTDCIRHWMPLSDALTAASWLFYTSRHVPFDMKQYLGVERAKFMWRYAEPEYREATGWAPSLSELLFDLRLFGASDPRDHVYGLYGKPCISTKHVEK